MVNLVGQCVAMDPEVAGGEGTVPPAREQRRFDVPLFELPYGLVQFDAAPEHFLDHRLQLAAHA